MKPTLVTGANGHVGNNLCRLLVARGARVRAMIRASADPAALAGLDVEIVHGDIRDAAATARAVAGCERVYHTAAGFLMWARDPERDIVASSVEGTRNVLDAAVRAGVEKVLYVSTGGTIGFTDSPDVILDETHDTRAPHTHYFRGKVAAEKEAFAIGARGKVPVVAINPGFILGPRFFKLSESVRQVADFVNRGMPFYFDGGFPVVDVEDVAQGAVLGLEKGRAGERYIVAGENVTVKQLYDLIAEFTGMRAPRLRAPVPVVRAIATVLELGGKLTGTRPLMDRNLVDEFAGRYGFMHSAKAERELGYTWRPAREVVRRTVAWLVDRG
ncbi:MAG: NAD-dependent epimerase/dehydratase family protein, partial [Deltaproteobacteria bacterium]